MHGYRYIVSVPIKDENDVESDTYRHWNDDGMSIACDKNCQTRIVNVTRIVI